MKKLIVLLTVFLFYACANEDIDDALRHKDLVKKDSELFKLLEKVSNNSNDPLNDIVCINFVYPFKILLYDANFQIINEVSVYNDANLSSFLGSINNSQLISISYPISTTLNNGTVFTINANDELKNAIDECAQEDLIVYYSGVFCPPTQCAWVVPYLEGKDNTYSSGVIKSNQDGTINFKYNNQNYTGTWTVLFVNGVANLNLSIDGNTIVGEDWRFNTKFQYDGIYLKLDKSGTSYYLEKKTKSTTTYAVGSTGPSGGIIAYKKPSFSDGWEYIEVATTDVLAAEWGCLSNLISFANYEQIGNGWLNSVKNMNFHSSLNNYFTNPGVCNVFNNGTLASKNSLLYIQDSKKDWFLPSKDELLLIHNSLHLQGLGNFAATNYWTSTQVGIGEAASVNFTTGLVEIKPKNTSLNVRAIRYF